MKTYCDLSDEALVRSYTAGNDEAFSVLVHRHKNRIFTTILLLVKDRTLAEDIFQEVFIKVINALKDGQYTDNSRFVAWVARIAHNCCISHFRKANTWSAVVVGYRDELSGRTSHEEPSEEQRIMTKELHQEMHDMLDRLPEAQREALILRYYADLSYKEIAQVVNIGINTALGRVRYAIMNLRKIMETARYYETAEQEVES